MKILPYILVLLLLSGCMRAGNMTDGVVEIVGVRDGVEVVRGMGVCVSKSEILTSAHVVRDDTLNYQLRVINHEGTPVSGSVTIRDSDTDSAYLSIVKREKGSIETLCQSDRKYIENTQELTLGQSISIPVMRDGSLVVLTGSITSLTGTILAYDALGRTQSLSGIVLTDISFLPGDSGAPILDGEWRVVDMVHVQ